MTDSDEVEVTDKAWRDSNFFDVSKYRVGVFRCNLCYKLLLGTRSIEGTEAAIEGGIETFFKFVLLGQLRPGEFWDSTINTSLPFGPFPTSCYHPISRSDWIYRLINRLDWETLLEVELYQYCLTSGTNSYDHKDNLIELAVLVELCEEYDIIVSEKWVLRDFLALCVRIIDESNGLNSERSPFTLETACKCANV